MVKIVWNRESGQATPKASHCGGRARLSAAADGQATIEYAIVTGVLIALVVIMGLFLTTFGDYGERLLAIIASDYP